MKTFATIFFVTGVSVMSAAAFRTDHSGFFVGGNAGYTFGHLKFNTVNNSVAQGQAWPDIVFSLGGKGLNAGLHGGYGKMWNRSVYLGIEGDFNIKNVDYSLINGQDLNKFRDLINEQITKLNNATEKGNPLVALYDRFINKIEIRQRFQAALAMRIGIPINCTLWYAKMGIALGRFQYKYSFQNISGAFSIVRNNTTHVGPLFGLGVETYIGKKMPYGKGWKLGLEGTVSLFMAKNSPKFTGYSAFATDGVHSYAGRPTVAMTQVRLSYVF